MRIPIATYRLQLTPAFGFRQAKERLAYLKELGISDLYLSPIFQARPQSEHGYDVVDHNRLNPELGSSEEFFALTDEIARRQLGLVQDIVPNHMAFAVGNKLLIDVLENGPAAKYARFFDIDWEHPRDGESPRLLAPFLGRFFGQTLEAAELGLDYGEEGFGVTYYDFRLPLKIESYQEILDFCLPRLRLSVGEEHPDYIQLLGVLYLLRTLRPDTAENERYDQIAFLKKYLWTLYRKSAPLRHALEQTLGDLRGVKGRPESFNRLEQLLAGQWFRLSFWKVAAEEINYRRFFCINDLISLAMENPEAFAQVHRLTFELLTRGVFSGLRIDHIDGLSDPQAYLAQLREQAPDSYLVVEKILAFGEPLPPWPIQGTTGYDFLNRVNALFCRGRNEKLLSAVYNRFTGMRQPFPVLVEEKKRLIVERHMSGEINNLARAVRQLAAHHRYGSDITLHGLQRALIEIMVRLPVYRTYLGPQAKREFDLEVIRQTVDQAVAHNPGLIHEAEFIGKILRLEFDELVPAEEQSQWLAFAMRFQQYTGPLTAKGFEDTLLYVYNRLLSLNEVGGQPDRFGSEAEEFHDFCRQRREHWPHSMNATATHDCKRGEDARARLNVLSEIPQLWRQALQSWSRLNRPLKKNRGRQRIPDKSDEYFFYQTLLGAWPAEAAELPDFCDRLAAYLIKAVREAKVHTAWIKPDQGYEEGFLQFAAAVLDRRRAAPFWAEFLPFQRRIAYFGLFNSLAQTLLKITAPGLPDFYQGSELWDLSLVDPDNRRPVDFGRRERALRELGEGFRTDPAALFSELLSHWQDGRVKLFLIHRALQVRHRCRELFAEGNYLPLAASGPRSANLLAFARQLGNDWVVTLAPRFVTELVEENELPLGPAVWQETILRLPADIAWTEALTGRKLVGQGTLPLGEVFRSFPAALLVSRGIEPGEQGSAS